MERQKLIEQLDSYIGTHREEILEDLKSLVRIPSVSNYCGGEKPFGEGVADVLDLALSKAEKRGFHTNNHNYWYGTAFLESMEQGDGLIGIFSHLDVVEAGEGWTYEPFEPVEKDGFLIGRGAGDNKSGAIIGLYTMQILKEFGIPIKSNVMLYFGTNEEKGMMDAEKFAVEHLMPDYSIVPDLFFPVCYGEKGGIKMTLQSRTEFHQITSMTAGKAENMIPSKAEAKIRLNEAILKEMKNLIAGREDILLEEKEDTITVTAVGVGGHSSLPKGTINAIWLLNDFLKDLTALDSGDREICAGIAKLSADYHGDAMGIANQDEPSGELICSPVKATMDGNLPCVLFNIRYPVTDYRERIEAEVIKVIAPLGFAMVSVNNNNPMYIEKNSPLVSRLTNLYNKTIGTQKEPFVIDGGTYARKLKNAVGFGGGNGIRAEFLPKGHGGVHQPDEARNIQGILDAIKVYVLAVMELDEMIQEQKDGCIK